MSNAFSYNSTYYNNVRPSNPNIGDFHYDTATGKTEYYNGTHWIEVQMHVDDSEFRAKLEFCQKYFGGLDFEKVVEVLKEKYPENFL